MGKYLIILLVVLFAIACEDISKKNSNGKENILHSEVEKEISDLDSIDDKDSLWFSIHKIENKESLHTNKIHLVDFYYKVGMLWYKRSDFFAAEEYFIKASELYLSLGDTLKSVQMHSNCAVLKEIQGDYAGAVEIYFEAIKTFQKYNDIKAIASVYGNVAADYEDLGMPEKAVEYNHKALRIKKQLDDSASLANTYNNLAVLYDELFHQPDSAIYYFEQALEIYKQLNITNKYAIVENNIAGILIRNQQLETILQKLDHALMIFDSLSDDHYKANVFKNYGKYYYLSGEPEKAIENYNKAYNLFVKYNNVEGQAESSKLLSEIYFSVQKYKEAGEQLLLYAVLNDSIKNKETKTTITEMETRFRVNEKNKTIELLRLQDELNRKKISSQTWLIILLSVIFSLIILVLYYYNYHNKLKQKQMRLELRNFMLQLNDMKKELNDKKDCEQKSVKEHVEKFDLSEREVEVLSLISEGYKNTEIAEKLFVSLNTIKTHIKNIYIKLNVKNRVEALRRVEMA